MSRLTDNLDDIVQRIADAGNNPQEQARIFEEQPSRMQRRLVRDLLSDEDFETSLSDKTRAKVENWLDDDTASVTSTDSFKTVWAKCNRRGQIIAQMKKSTKK